MSTIKKETALLTDKKLIELYITKKSELITTILGSCISIVLFDEQNSIGGINHYMLPAAPPESTKNSGLPITRFGEYAIKTLIQEMINQGASLKNLKAKIFGGSNVLNFSSKKALPFGDVISHKHCV